MRTRSRIYLIALALFSLFLSGCKDGLGSRTSRLNRCLERAAQSPTEMGVRLATTACRSQYPAPERERRSPSERVAVASDQSLMRGPDTLRVTIPSEGFYDRLLRAEDTPEQRRQDFERLLTMWPSLDLRAYGIPSY